MNPKDVLLEWIAHKPNYSTKGRAVEITPQMIAAAWENLPSPQEIDTENEEAIRQLIRAILNCLGGFG